MFTLLYEQADEAIMHEKVLPLFADHQATAIPFDTEHLKELPERTTVVAYLNDAALKRLFAEAPKHDWTLSLLPHPGAKHARLGMGIASKLDEAAADILTHDDDPPHVDLMSCNGTVVLNSVVIGDPFTGTPGSAAVEGPFARLRRFLKLTIDLLRTTPARVKLKTAKGQEIETAALGIIVVEHARSALLSRRIIDDSAANDGMLHALVYAPRSVAAMLGFLFRSVLLPRPASAAKLPVFVGHIKTESLHITPARAIGFSIDGQRGEGEEIILGVQRDAITLIPGRHLAVEKAPAEPKEAFRVKGLLTTEALDAMKARKLPIINHASPDEFKDLFQMLREGARPSESYIMLMILATVLATFGLFSNSAPVIIGAMILAPLMSPIVAMSMGVLRVNERNLLLESLKACALGVGVALGCAVLLTWLTPLRTLNSEIAARLNPTLLDMGVAVASGVAGAYAHARAQVTKSLAGVAIAVALVPPLAVSGIGIGWGDWTVFSGAGLLFLTNFAGMILAAAGTFLVLGYSPFRFSGRGLASAIAAVVIVSVLLIPSFSAMVTKHNIIDRLDGWSTNGISLRDITIQLETPLRVSVTLLAKDEIDLDTIDGMKAKIEERLGRDIVLEATVRVVR